MLSRASRQSGHIASAACSAPPLPAPARPPAWTAATQQLAERPEPGVLRPALAGRGVELFHQSPGAVLEVELVQDAVDLGQDRAVQLPGVRVHLHAAEQELGRLVPAPPG